MTEERPDINAVLEHYGTTVRDRRSYMTNCVFHEDRTPSLSVNTEKHLWNCKSCGQSGDSFTLIMLKEEIPAHEFGRAIEVAATLGLATGSAGGGDSAVRSGYLSPRRARSGGKGDRPGHSSYVPRWRRN